MEFIGLEVWNLRVRGLAGLVVLAFKSLGIDFLGFKGSGVRVLTASYISFLYIHADIRTLCTGFAAHEPTHVSRP